MNRTFFFDTAWLPAGWRRKVRVTVRGGLICEVACGAAAAPQDVQLALALPGVPNLHSHAFQRAMAGLAERRGPSGTDDFWSWREVMYRFLERIDPDDLEIIAAYTYADLLEGPNWQAHLKDRMKAQHLEEIRRLMSGDIVPPEGDPGDR